MLLSCFLCNHLPIFDNDLGHDSEASDYKMEEEEKDYKLFLIIDQRSQHESDFSQGYYQIAVLDEAEYHNEQLETPQNILPHWFRGFTVMA